MHQASWVTELGLALGRDEWRGDGRARQSCVLNRGVDPADRLADGTSATPTGRHPLIRQLPNIKPVKRPSQLTSVDDGICRDTYAATS